jgi:hypothetical protein
MQPMSGMRAAGIIARMIVGRRTTSISPQFEVHEIHHHEQGFGAGPSGF